MALKRHEEETWNWKTPKAPFPQTPGANGCYLAPSGQGKITTLISMLLGPYAKVFDEVHIFSPSVDVDTAWDPVKKKCERPEGFEYEQRVGRECPEGDHG